MRDSGYMRGLALRDQIYKDQPFLKEYTRHMFKDCDSSIDEPLSPNEAEQVTKFIP